MTNSFGHFERSVSFALKQPQMHSVSHFITIEIDGKECLENELNK